MKEVEENLATIKSGRANEQKEAMDKLEEIINADGLKGTIKDVALLVKTFAKIIQQSSVKFEEHNKNLESNIEGIDLYLHALKKVPTSVETKISAIAPIVGKEITLQHMQYIEEFKQHINSCGKSFDSIKTKFENFQWWWQKKALVTIGIATIIAMLASISTTYIMFKYNPPKHETRILKADNVHADNTVHIFDMTGKFCDKAVIPKDKK